MKLIQGMVMDTAENDQPAGTYRYAKNIVDYNTILSKENEDGFFSIGTLAPYTVIGIVPIANDFVVFSTNNVNSEIGLVTKGAFYAYAQVYANDALNFNTAHPITGEYKLQNNSQRVVAFRDDVNIPRIINIDDVASINDINDLAVFPDVNNPAYSFSILDTGGTLKTGALIPITKYKDSTGATTNWFVHDQVIYINDDAKTLAFNDDDGSEGGIVSNKSVSLTFSGCDTRFTTLILGYIQIANGLLTAYEAKEIVNASTINTALTGNESTTDVTIDEILTATTNYNTAKTITQLSGRLFLGNLTTEALPKIQPWVNGIKINYTTEVLGIVPNNTGVHKDNLPPTLIPGEVYALYLGIELNKGGWAFYPIPGREAKAGETTVTTSFGMTYKKFQVENTSNNGSGDTNMGYWENSNELYPDNAQYDGSSLGNYNIRNQPVRHHRMPTYDYLANTTYVANGNVGITSLPRILLNVTNVIIPADVQLKIKRWKIFYAKKDNSNSLFMGSDLLQFGVSQATDSTVRWGTGGNWAVDGEDGGGTWEDFNAPSVDTIRGHCLDFLVDGSVLTPNYAWFNYKLRRTNINDQYIGFRSAGGLITITGSGVGSNTSAVIDFTSLNTTKTTGGFIKSLSNFIHLPANASSGKFKTLYTEGVYVADINSPSTSFSGLAFDTLLTNSGGTAADLSPWSGSIGGEETMYMTYHKLLSDVHISFSQQDLVPLTSYATPATTSLSNIAGGNGFLCYMSYLACGPNNANPDATQTNPFTEGTRVWKAYVGYAKRNFNYRYQTPGDVTSYYHGKTDVRSLFTPYASVFLANHQIKFGLDTATNVVQYADDYNRTNDYIVGVIWSSILEEQTSFPNTVIFSPIDSWRTFLVEDSYTTIKNKGVIVNIQGFNNQELLIHLERSLLRTRTDARQMVEGENVFLKSANIFDLPPEELAPSREGYGGTQHQYSAVLTKVGYAYVNDLQGKVFLYDGQGLSEISMQGMRSFFRDFMGVGASDNPFTSNGYTTGFDERYNRLLFSKKNGDTSWTVSYNPLTKTWTSFHDYQPDYMFMTSDNLLHGIKFNEFFLMNPPPASTQKGKFFDSTIYSSYMDVISNIEPTVDKEFVGASWVSEVYPNGITFGQLSTDLQYTATCTHLTVRTPQHCTGRLTLSNFTGVDDLYDTTLRNINRTWYFNDIRDVALSANFLLGFYSAFTIDVTKLNTSMEWYDQRRFVDKYVTCRYEFDNLLNYRWLFIDSNIDYKNVAK